MEGTKGDRTEMERIPSGIPGLDELVEGGFPFPSVILLSGSAGTGKTTFCLRFLCEGAKRGERGLFFTTLSEPTHWMLRFSSQFEFMRPEYFDKDIVYVDMGDLLRSGDQERILEAIDLHIAEVMPQRIVIDPLTVVGDMFKGDYRNFLFDLTNRLKHWNATTLVTGEVRPGELYPPEISYAVDGILLLLLNEEYGDRRKYLEVLKMRGTAHSSAKHSIDISRKEGMIVLKARF